MGKAWPVKVRYTRRALRQMSDILDYVQVHSPQGAENVKRRLKAAIDLLADYPESERPTNRGDLRRSWRTHIPMSSSTERMQLGSSFTMFATPPVAPVEL